MLEQKIRAGWERAMRPIGRLLARLGFTPNSVTIMGVLFQGAVTYFVVTGHLLIGGVIEIVAVFSDTWDGAVAKVTGKTSKFGALLDSTTDRLSDALFFLAVAWLYGVSPDPAHDGQEWVAAVSMAALVSSILVSYVKARAQGLGFECNVGIAGRAERAIGMCAGLILNFLLPAIVCLLAVLSTITFVQRLLHVRKQAQSPRVV